MLANLEGMCDGKKEFESLGALHLSFLELVAFGRYFIGLAETACIFMENRPITGVL
jgi:hypothetical protein